MEALTSSFSTMIFTRNINKTLSPSSALALPRRSKIGFSGFPTFKRLHFHHMVSSRTIARSHLVSDAAEALLESGATEIPKTKTSKTMHVKFQLQKECMFGDQFMLVGDAPMLGLWNPADAIQMHWSDGHIWNVELDVPIDSTVQFKFILKQCSGEMLWQPGPDRIFKSWESCSTIIISEDWENPEAQKILEEQLVKESVMKPDTEPINVAGDVSREELFFNMNNDVTFSGAVKEK